MKKILAIVTVAAMILATSSTALATQLPNYTIRASNSTSQVVLSSVARDYTGWSVQNGICVAEYSATKLTLRAYTMAGSKNGNAKTFPEGSASGGQVYTYLQDNVYMKGNSDFSIYGAEITGNWYF